MKREKQIEYCRKCLSQEFDFNQGIICGLTKRKADFENECENFEIDKEIIEKIKIKNNKTRKAKIAFGFSPKQISNISVEDLSKKQALVLAYETVKKLGWNIGFLHASGFMAYTKFSFRSWSEEVKIKIEVGNINIKSECAGNQFTDWGKNRKNIDLFVSTFTELQHTALDIVFEAEYLQLSKDFIADEDSAIVSKSPLTKKEKISGLVSLFKPTEGYFVSPILVNINISIFIVMVLTGNHLLMPSSEDLLFWGANFRPLTVEGEWWRLLSSVFIHIGIFHLLMNMYALIYIGLILEPYIGKTRFLSAYLLSGIAGSISSLYWNEITISAGASGAIFGMYGVFLALITTNLIDKSVRKALLVSIVVFVGYNILNGIKPNSGIDNAAHIGGLLSGLLIGYAYIPSLKPNNSILLKYSTITILFIILLVCATPTINSVTPSDIDKYKEEMRRFDSMEAMALEVYRLPQNTPKEKILYEIQDRGMYYWRRNIKLLNSFENLDLPEHIVSRNDLLKKYCRIRLKCFQLMYKMVDEETFIYQNEIDQYNREIDLIIDDLSGKE